jgi:hypothetical protein
MTTGANLRHRDVCFKPKMVAFDGLWRSSEPFFAVEQVRAGGMYFKLVEGSIILFDEPSNALS